MRAMDPSNSVIPQNHPQRAIILSSSYRPARWVMAKSKYKAHSPTASRWTGLTPGGLASFGASAPEHLPLPFVPKQDFVIVTCKHIATLTLDPNVVLTARGDRPMSLKSLEKDCCRATRGRSSATTTHVRMQERLIPLVCKTPSVWAEVDRVMKELSREGRCSIFLVRKSQGTV